ncbi:MAG TPA: DUF2207 domain-containing protein [Dokdonella sp.]|uniref:DUF2207 domain-containing protein n=1 Tax=Dokdonella sp. TaxID=2291710 RepID=UPI002BFDA292|nr:DUF2207 domain-containing protein [Dokdonella sp.]HUD41452.1 DUF2207 domain-containing protein [Dokdonella sp.]
MNRLRSRLRRILLAGLLGWCAAAGSAAADERIVSYDSVVAIQADGMLEVTEHITVRAEGGQIKRGIYRDFPTRYRDRYGNRVVVGFQMLGVERNGVEEPWFTERRRNGVRINTGDDTAIERPAVHRYTLRYRTSRQIGYFADHDELYWNAIGTGWAFPIDAGSVEVTLPQPVPVAALAAEGYTGPQGAKGQAYTATLPAPGQARWRLSAPLAPGEGFTIVLSFPKGVLAEPAAGQRLAWFFSDNRALLVALAGLAILLIYCRARWHRVGRDPPAGVIIARYEPPAGHSPAALRFMRRMRYDTRCFSAGVLALAVAGRLRIRHDEAEDAEAPWSLLATGATGAALPEDEAALLAGLFADGSESLVLDNAQAQTLRNAQSAQQAVLEKAFHPAFFARNLGSTLVALAIALATAIAALVLARTGGGGMPLVLAACLAMFVVVIVFGFLVHAPTAQGRRLLDEIEGFRRYLGVAERAELGSLRGPEPAIDAAHYERLLPYAVALDVEEAWTRRFTAAVGTAAAAAATAGIAWYHGSSVLDPTRLTHAVGSGLSATIASASTPPGSGSGAGGGGFSGGGGGGGGGGGR